MQQLMLAVGFVCLVLACQPLAADRAADERAIRQTEAEWAKAALSNDVERFVSFYADDAALLVPGQPVVTGKEAIRKAAGDLFNTPGFSLTFQSTKVEVAKSGDLGYTHGAYAMTMNDPSGKPAKDTGKFVAAYRKQAGQWKAVADIFNTDLPPQKH